MEEQQQADKKAGTKKWLARLGIAGFIFFLVKGLVWIGIALFAAKSCG